MSHPSLNPSRKVSCDVLGQRCDKPGCGAARYNDKEDCTQSKGTSRGATSWDNDVTCRDVVQLATTTKRTAHEAKA